MSNTTIAAIPRQTQDASIWTGEQVDLIKRTVAKGATDDELKLFLYRCRNLELDPLKPGQIYFIKYGTSPGTVVVGIDGFRARAARTGRLSGIKRGALYDVNGKLVGAWAEVYRNDWQHPAREEVPLSEYNTGKSQWVKMPETMIKKVAECAALRMAFPDDLGGLYSPEEMDQAAEHQAPAREAAPKALPANDAKAAIKEFFELYEVMSATLGPDCYKKYLRNKAGESPEIKRVLEWKSDKQIAWLKSETERMRADWEQQAAGMPELPDFDEAADA